MTTIFVSSLGTKFIPKWRDANLKSSGNLVISKEDFKTVCYLWKLLREHFVSTNNFVFGIISWQKTHQLKEMNFVGNSETELITSLKTK